MRRVPDTHLAKLGRCTGRAIASQLSFFFSQPSTNLAIRPIKPVPPRIGAWPWSGTVTASMDGWRVRIAFTVSSDGIGVRPAQHHQRQAAERAEFRPQRGDRPVEVDAGERLGKLDVVGRQNAAFLGLERAMCIGEPFGVGEPRELLAEQAAQDSAPSSKLLGPAVCRHSS